MKAYEDRLYEQWKVQVQSALPALLKRNLLAKPDPNNIKSERNEDDEMSDTEIGSITLFIIITQRSRL